MTAGIEEVPGSFKSYRGRLYQLLTNAGIDVDFIGTVYSVPAIGGDPDHDGYGGAYIGPGGSSNNLWDRLPVVLGSSVDPDIIIMAFGWNSVIYEPGEAASKYRGITNQISAIKPSAKLMLATLSPSRGETQAQSNGSVPSYRAINDMARSMANASSNDNLFVADLAASDYANSDYWDVIHWSQSGADRAAQIVFDALMAGPLKP
jgi:hypothetical protein